jgi:hypothetical protein
MSGCAAQQVATPRQYLDDATASTITIVSNPWILTRTGAPPQLDLLHLYAVDVNQTGHHGRYLAVIQYWPAATATKGERAQLILTTADAQTRLEPVSDNHGQLGIGQPLDAAAPGTAKTWFYPLDAQTLASLSASAALAAKLVTANTSADYVSWRDGSAELKAFAATIQSRKSQ